MASICNICCEPHNRSTRLNIVCEYGDCGFEACKSCVRQYLLSTTQEPHCMNCKKAWGQDFLVRKLNRSFVTSDYKVHRSNLLCEREISKLPDTMAAAENFKAAEAEKKRYHELLAESDKLRDEMQRLRKEAGKHWYNSQRIQNGGQKEQKREFIMPCQNDGCRGFLSTAYKCGLCHIYTCPKCLDLVGYEKDNTHVCKEENIQSAELIRKDTKPCPSCGTRIFKIDGCDQMWCSNCHKAWSWRTGKIDHGTIHNPHYYEFQRNGGGTVPRAPGDEVCGGLCHYTTFRTDIVRRIKDKWLVDDLTRLHRTLAHIIHHELQTLRGAINRDNDQVDLRIQYILGRLEKEALSKTLYRKDIARRKSLEMVQVYEILNQVGIELFVTLRNSGESGEKYEEVVRDQLDNFHQLRIYCNEQFEKIGKTYSRTIPVIQKSWNMTTVKP